MFILLCVIGGLLVLVLLLALIAPKNYDVFRTIEITKPKTEVFEYLKYLGKQQEWSPWAKKDPKMETKLTGIDGEVGAVHYWIGNKDVGEGEQEITKIIDGERVEGELRFMKPFKSTSDCYMNVESISDSSTKVTWGFSGNNKFPMSIMMLFMSMDKMVGKDFEEGLQCLKVKLES